MAPSPATAMAFETPTRFRYAAAPPAPPPLPAGWSGPDGVSVVIPAWNEEERLPVALETYLRFLEAYSLPFEVIVVVDGVTDGTVRVAERFASRGVRVLQFDDRLGKGGAVMAGFAAAKYDLVGFLDADAPITTVNVAYLLSELTHHEGAIASRWHPRSSQVRSQSRSRLLFSRVWNLLTRMILNLDVRDSQCGAKFFRRSAVMSVLPQVTLTNWAFDASLLFHFRRAGFSIAEVPVNWSDDPNTKLRVERVLPAMMLSLVGIRLMSLPALPHVSRAWAGWLYRVLQ